MIYLSNASMSPSQQEWFHLVRERKLRRWYAETYHPNAGIRTKAQARLALQLELRNLRRHHNSVLTKYNINFSYADSVTDGLVARKLDPTLNKIKGIQRMLKKGIYQIEAEKKCEEWAKTKAKEKTILFDEWLDDPRDFMKELGPACQEFIELKVLRDAEMEKPEEKPKEDEAQAPVDSPMLDDASPTSPAPPAPDSREELHQRIWNQHLEWADSYFAAMKTPDHIRSLRMLSHVSTFTYHTQIERWVETLFENLMASTATTPSAENLQLTTSKNVLFELTSTHLWQYSTTITAWSWPNWTCRAHALIQTFDDAKSRLTLDFGGRSFHSQPFELPATAQATPRQYELRSDQEMLNVPVMIYWVGKDIFKIQFPILPLVEEGIWRGAEVTDLGSADPVDFYAVRPVRSD